MQLTNKLNNFKRNFQFIFEFILILEKLCVKCVIERKRVENKRERAKIFADDVN